MKKLAILTAVAAMATATPALANDFTGVRAEVTAGLDDVVNGRDTNNVTYGVGIGADGSLGGGVIVGAEATVDNVFDRRDIGAAVRVGYLVSDNVLMYGKVGYANWRQTTTRELDGLRLGAGLEANLGGPVYAKVEYRYTDFEAGIGQHGGLVGFGLRF